MGVTKNATNIAKLFGKIIAQNSTQANEPHLLLQG